MNTSVIMAAAPLLENDAKFSWSDVTRRLPDTLGADQLRELEFMFLLGLAVGARRALTAMLAAGPVIGDVVTQAQLRADILTTVERHGLRPGAGAAATVQRFRKSVTRAQALLDRRRAESKRLGKRRKGRKVRK